MKNKWINLHILIYFLFVFSVILNVAKQRQVDTALKLLKEFDELTDDLLDDKHSLTIMLKQCNIENDKLRETYHGTKKEAWSKIE